MNQHQRRTAASERRRHRQRTNTSQDVLPARIVRRSCSQCGAPIAWIDNDVVADVIGPRLHEFLAFMPTRIGLVALVRGDFWLCQRAACAEFGVVLPDGLM